MLKVDPITISAMRAYGGGFVNKLVDLLEHADAANTQRILHTWSHLFDDYGSGSAFYSATASKGDDS